jgi:hypothetical protein
MYTLNMIYEARIEVDFGNPPDHKEEAYWLSLAGISNYAMELGNPDNNVDVSVDGSRYRLNSVITVTGERVEDVRRVADLIVADGKTREGCKFV